MTPVKLVCLFLGLTSAAMLVSGNADAKRLYEDLMSSYNRLIRPVGNNSDTLTVNMSLKLSQIIDVNIKNQIMTTNMWVEQEWNDYKLRWEPEEYGGVSKLHVPSEQIWLPDIVLYNNADGNYEVTIMTKAILHHDGHVIWKPPAIYKSSCNIDVEFFPFDQQTCFMKFGSWTYDGFTVDLKHKYQDRDSNEITLGMDLTEFWLSVEWDIMSVPARRRDKFYSCCQEPFPDITFNVTLRRKTLFYTVNLIIPCILISALSILVFYLPSDSGEKVSLSISIMLSLGVFFVLLAEIIPPTSLVMPLLGKYLVFTTVLVTLSASVTIVVVNVHFRSPATHRMAPWVRSLFMHILPKILLIPEKDDDSENDTCKNNNVEGTELGKQTELLWNDLSEVCTDATGSNLAKLQVGNGRPRASLNSPIYGPSELDTGLPIGDYQDGAFDELGIVTNVGFFGPTSSTELDKATKNIVFIAQHMDNSDQFENICEDWKYVAMVLDRFFLWLFAAACIIGTAWIFLRAPSLYDFTQPIDIKLSKLAGRGLRT